MARPRVLLITKGHPFDRGAFLGMFDAMNIDWTHVEQPAARLFQRPDTAAEYDALVMYDMPGITFGPQGPEFEQPSEDFRQGFTALLDAGKGMLFLHHAIAGWPAWEEYAEIMGGRFNYVPGELRGKQVADSGYRHQVRHNIEVVADHPVTQGLPPRFEMVDELYLFDVFEPDVTPLLRSDYTFTRDNFHSAAKVVTEGQMYSNEGWEHADGSPLVGWLKRYGNSPIIYIQGGDDAAAYTNPHYRKLVEQAIHWLADQDALA